MKTYSHLLHDRRTVEDLFSIGLADLGSEGFESHGHDYAELVIIFSGTGIHSTGKASYPVRSGDIFVIREGEIHGFTDCQHLRMYNISFPLDFHRAEDFQGIDGINILFDMEPQLRTGGDSGSMFHADPLQMERIMAICREMEHEQKSRELGFRAIFRSHLIRLMILIVRYYTHHDNPSSQKMMKMASCLADLESRFDQEISLSELAGTHGYSTEHFIRMFRMMYDSTPKQYIIQLRLSRASEQLRDSSKGISEIAWDCGFSDSNYFSRLFRNKMGLSPRDYRKLHRGG